MIVDCKTQNCSGQLNSNGGFRCPTTPEQKKYRKGLCMGTTLNYIMKSAALFDVTNNNTIKAYKKNIEDFCDWSKKILGITKSQVLDNPITVVQAYSDMLYRQYPATTAHKYLSPICKGLGIHLQDISINRNIVECKSKDKGQFINQFIELIETLWNVNPFDCI